MGARRHARVSERRTAGGGAAAGGAPCARGRGGRGCDLVDEGRWRAVSVLVLVLFVRRAVRASNNKPALSN